MTRHLTTLSLLATGCLMLAGCARQSPGSYDGGKSDSWTGQKQKPYPSSSLTPPALPVVVVKKSLITESVSYDAMAPVSYKPMSVTITPTLPQCPPLHCEATPGWGYLAISGPAVETLDYVHCGCPEHPGINIIRAWLTETTDYTLPVQRTGVEFAKIVPFETE